MAIIEKETFSQLVKQPGQITADAVPQLEATIKAFPYCQIAYSLLAKATAGSDKLDETRPRAAAYALSRVALQQLVENSDDRYDFSAGTQLVEEEPAKVESQNGEDILITLVEQKAVSTEIDKSEEQRRQRAIIEGFMKKNPRINRQESNLEPIQLDLTGRVADGGGEVIETEAFAKVLVKQGKIERAIDVYQKLILIKPEKRNYFAKKLSELYHIQGK